MKIKGGKKKTKKCFHSIVLTLALGITEVHYIKLSYQPYWQKRLKVWQCMLCELNIEKDFRAPSTLYNFFSHFFHYETEVKTQFRTLNPTSATTQIDFFQTLRHSLFWNFSPVHEVKIQILLIEEATKKILVCKNLTRKRDVTRSPYKKYVTPQIGIFRPPLPPYVTHKTIDDVISNNGYHSSYKIPSP